MTGRYPRTPPWRAQCSSSGAAFPTYRLPALDGLRAHCTNTEADTADVGGTDLDICDLRRLHEETTALLVGQGQHARILAERIGDQLLHLAGCLRAVEDQLARAVRDTDLDLHAGPFPFVCSSRRLVDGADAVPRRPLRE